MSGTRCGLFPRTPSRTSIANLDLTFFTNTIGFRSSNNWRGLERGPAPPPFPIPCSFLKKLFSRLIDVLCSKYLKRGIWHFARKNTVWCGHEGGECQNPFSRIFCNANMPFAPFNTSSSSYMHNQTISNWKNTAFRHFVAGIGDFCSGNKAQYI